MRPARIAGATRLLEPPKNWDEERRGSCVRLAIRDTQIENGERTSNYMTSAWEPMSEEIGWMLAGGHVHVGMPGSQHPPISIEGQLPPEDGPPVIIARPFQRDGKEWVRVEMYAPARIEPARPAAWTWYESEIREHGLAMSAALGIEACEASLANRPFARGGETA